MKSSEDCLMFLDALVHLPGVTQACVVLPDRQVMTASATGTAMHNEAAWRTLQDLFKKLRVHALPAQRVCLGFGDWVVIALQSPEVVCGVVMLQADVDANEQGVRDLFQQFVDSPSVEA
jgi:hypothetical protein